MADSAQSQQFRLHIGGLGPSVSSQDLQKRFSSFGQVTKVDGVGKLDANGFPLKYGFVELISTESQIKRCMNLLSGTTYKGDTLRIAPARPDYRSRIEREKAGLPIHNFTDPDEEELKAREEKLEQKRQWKMARLMARKKGIEGYESENMRLMTLKRFKSRQGINGWKKDPATSLPIFPLIARPSHPLPFLDLPETPTPSEKEASTPSLPPTRARRIRIDPTIYRAAIKSRKTHIVGPRAMSIEQYRLGFVGGAKDVKKSQSTRRLWECDVAGEGQVVWRLRDSGDVAQEERVKLSGSTIKTLAESIDPYSQDTSQRQAPQPRPSLPTHPPNTINDADVVQPKRTAERQLHLDIFRELRAPRTTWESVLDDLDPEALEEVQRQKKCDETTCMVDKQSVELMPLRQDKSSTNRTGSPPSSPLSTHAMLDDLVSSQPSGSSSKAQPCDTQADTLRLRGGSSTKRPRRSKGKGKSPDHLPKPSEGPNTSEPTSHSLEPSSFEEVSAKLKAERERYVSLARQTTTLTVNKTIALEDVGQGSQEAVKRQKAKELKHRWHLSGSKDDDDGIELVPATEAGSIELNCARIAAQTLVIEGHGVGQTVDTAITPKPPKPSRKSEKNSKVELAPSLRAPDNPSKSRPLSKSASSNSSCLSQSGASESASSSESESSESPSSGISGHKKSQNISNGERAPSAPTHPTNHHLADTEKATTVGAVSESDISKEAQGFQKKNNVSEVQLSNLTDMFRAKEAEKVEFRLTDTLGGFELADEEEVLLGGDAGVETMDIDRSPAEERSFERDQHSKSNMSIHPSRLLASGGGLMATPSSQTPQTGRKGLFFVFPIEDDGLELDGIGSVLSIDHFNRARQQSQAHMIPSSLTSWRTFIRTESNSQIDEEHGSKKTELTEQMRRKHKDSIKRNRKWGHKQSRKPLISTVVGAESDHDV